MQAENAGSTQHVRQRERNWHATWKTFIKTGRVFQVAGRVTRGETEAIYCYLLTHTKNTHFPLICMFLLIATKLT